MYDGPVDRKGWLVQHYGLKMLDPPYVYNVVSVQQPGAAGPYANRTRSGMKTSKLFVRRSSPH